MKKNKLTIAINQCLTLCLGSLIATQTAFAAEETIPAEAVSESVERISVTGSRGVPRSVADSAVPIDVLSADDLSAVAFTDMNDVIGTLVPSYSVTRQPISDGGTFVRPATLRGLPTDKTLVLVNSKRRHRSALVTIGGSGTQGPDVATIPAIALKGVEVLRDGAAAQYGSDAIAGVINFQLKDNSEGGSLTVDFGQYSEGDGESTTIAGNYGFALGDDGFLSLSFEKSHANASSRSEQYCEDWFCLDKNNPDYEPGASYNTYLDDPDFMAGVEAAGEVVQPWGQPNSEATRLFFNMGYMFSDAAELYSYGSYSKSEADGGFFYRYPGNGTIEDYRLEDGSIWNPLAIYPGGFTPRFFGEVTDYSLVTGLKGELTDSLSYDISGRIGSSDIAYTLKNTMNPSMGPDTPMSFRPGDLTNEEMQIQADLIYVAGDVVTVFGVSYMDESYELTEGDPDSYAVGDFALPDPYGFCDGTTPTTAGAAVIATGSTLDCSDSSDPVFRASGVGSNGFPGYSPEYSGKYERDSYSAFIDVSADVTDDLFLQAALRYEDYSDFGSETVYKIAGLYKITDEYSVRASYGTGFRAPTPGQQGTTNVSTRLPNGFPVATGLFPALSNVSQALGAEPLKAETSENVTFGFTANYGDFSFTIDYYHIAIEDRVNAISTLDVSSDPASDDYDNYLALVDAGVVGAESIGGVFYFQNAFDTITEGVDIVANYSFDNSLGRAVITASMNHGTNELDSDVEGILNDEDQFDFENNIPKNRGFITFKQDYDDFNFLLRATYFGEYKNANGSRSESTGEFSEGNLQTFGEEWMFDLEASYQISDMITLILGARNITDEYPDKSDVSGDTCCGRVYFSDSVVDWQGSYYYGKIVATF